MDAEESDIADACSPRGACFLVNALPIRKQLYARGIARHDPEVITRKGRADLDALSAFLRNKPFLLTDGPTSADTAVFGLLAPTVYWSMETPVAMYARSLPNLKSYCDRMREHCFDPQG